MADALIENPILNSPFHEPDRHFKFTDEGITNEIVEGRRSSSYFIPIARPKKKGKQLAFDTEWTQDRIEENKTVNRIRQRVGMWREGGRGPPLLPPQARSAEDRSTHRRRSQRSRETRGGSPHLDLGHRGRQGQDRRQGDLRPVGHAVLPPRLGLSRRDALPLGRLRLLADRRHRGRHRQGPARARRRRLDARATSPPTATSGSASASTCPERDARPRQLDGEPKLPAELQGALHSLYGNYEKYHALWEQNADAQAKGHHAAGLHRRLQQHQRLEARLRLHRRLGESRSPTARRSSCRASCRIFSNDDGNGGWSPRPNTILVDSEQLESGEGDERRLQEDRRPRNRRVQGRIPRPLPRPRRRRA